MAIGVNSVSRICVIAEILQGERLLLAVVQTEETQQGVEHFAHTVGRLPDITDISLFFIRIILFSHQRGITDYCV